MKYILPYILVSFLVWQNWSIVDSQKWYLVNQMMYELFVFLTAIWYYFNYPRFYYISITVALFFLISLGYDISLFFVTVSEFEQLTQPKDIILAWSILAIILILLLNPKFIKKCQKWRNSGT